MTLEVLQAAMIAAMKEHDKLRKDTISSLIGAIKKTAIDKKCKDNITEELVNEVILKEKKTVQEMIDTCPATRLDLLSEYSGRMIIIDKFAPVMMSEAEVRAFIEQEISALADSGIEISVKSKGIVMKTITPKLKGKVDMKIVNNIVGEMLK